MLSLRTSTRRIPMMAVHWSGQGCRVDNHRIISYEPRGTQAKVAPKDDAMVSLFFELGSHGHLLRFQIREDSEQPTPPPPHFFKRQGKPPAPPPAQARLRLGGLGPAQVWRLRREGGFRDVGFWGFGVLGFIDKPHTLGHAPESHYQGPCQESIEVSG